MRTLLPSIRFLHLRRHFQQFIIPDNLESTRKFYETNEELIHDIANAYREVIKQFYDAGCRNLQFDTAHGAQL